MSNIHIILIKAHKPNKLSPSGSSSKIRTGEGAESIEVTTNTKFLSSYQIHKLAIELNMNTCCSKVASMFIIHALSN
jgi:hypothetical protein